MVNWRRFMVYWSWMRSWMVDDRWWGYNMLSVNWFRLEVRNEWRHIEGMKVYRRSYEGR